MTLPFKNLDRYGWLNLVITAILTFYTVQVAFELLKAPIFSNVGGDFLAFWSVGKIALEHGFARIYDLDLLAQTQYLELLNPTVPVIDYQPVPVPLFSIFVIPFSVLSLMGALPSFLTWTILNGLVFVGYIVFFLHWISRRGGRIPNVILYFLIGSYPVFQNFYWGQVEVWLLIFVGEFIRAYQSNKPWLAGLWLGGVLLKPQILVLIVPYLIITRAWKIFGGFSLSAFAIIIVSMILSGVNGFTSLFALWIKYLPGIHSNGPENMTNWRMLGLHLNSITSSNFGWIFAATGMVFTLIVCYRLLPNKRAQKPDEWLMGVMGVFTATLIFTWHSHIHMAMIIIPFILLAYGNHIISARVITIWVLTPALLQILVLIVATMMTYNLIPFVKGFGGLVLGLSGLIVDVILIFQLLRTRNRIGIVGDKQSRKSLAEIS